MFAVLLLLWSRHAVSKGTQGSIPPDVMKLLAS